MVYNRFMKNVIKYRGRHVTAEDIGFIKELISKNQLIGRCELSRQICQQWNWVQANGHPRDMVCRGLLLELERNGYIVLPPRKLTPVNPFLKPKSPKKIEVDQSPIKTTLKEILPLSFVQVRRTPLEKLFNSLICHHHYLGYTQPVGEHLKYLVYSNSSQRPVACFAWSSAVRHLESRDRFIGWNKETRTKNLHLIAYNTRFLIPDWIRVRYLASHLLAKCARIISPDWEKVYNHPVYWLETFVDTERFEGTCYKSANWLYLGKTKGLGKNAPTKKVNRSFKAVWGYPLSRNFRELLNQG
jgi:hypothetical protein